MQYRYQLTPNSNINHYKPKDLPEDADWNALRSSQLGACFVNHFHEMPKNTNCRVVYEACFRSKPHDIPPGGHHRSSASSSPASEAEDVASGEFASKARFCRQDVTSAVACQFVGGSAVFSFCQA